ncbi:MAG: FAD-dependent oxidoreductase, partial [Planctomycetota bacterium]|nr:FAD-dependent oxidoreductase [Planctomycetota bacterium]
MIVGGGVSGLTAADVMNSLGTSVTIVERRPVLGGILCDLRRQVPGDNCRFCTVAESADGCLRVAAKKLGSIETLTETGITGVKKRRRGGFTVTLNNREGEEVDREFDSILLATGVSELCSEEELKEFGYGGGKDVLTALEFERMCIAVNDGRAKFVRSDGMPVRSVAFIGCVGSRNKSRRYCSATCCSYTLRQFNALKQAAEIENAKFFLMDLRLTDKRMWNYARNMLERGLDLVRCRLTKVERGEESVLLRYESDRDGIKTESFDLVVLMTAQVPDKEVQKKFSPLGVGFDENGFVVTKGGAATDVKGIFACGCATGPKSISESVIDSLSASADIAEYLSLKTEGTVVVFGGGVASLSSSIALSRLGLRVELVQNQSTKTRTLTDEEKKLWDRLARDVNRTGSITIHEEAKIESVR